MDKINIPGLAKLFASSIYGQLITLISLPIVSRTYAPDVIGEFNVFISIVGLSIPIASLSLSTIVVMPKDNNEALGLAATCLFVTSALSLIMSPAVILIAYAIGVMHADSYTEIVYVLTVHYLSVVFMVYCSLQNNISVRNNKYEERSKHAFYLYSFLNLAKISLGYIHPIMQSLCISHSLAYTLSTLAFSNKNLLLKTKNILFHEKIGKFYDNIKEYKGILMHKTSQTFLYYLNQSMPMLALSKIYDNTQVGYYGMALAILTMPASFIGKMVFEYCQSMFLAIKKKNNRPYPVLIKATLTCLGLSISGIIISEIILEELILVVLGNQWTGSVQYARVLIYYVAVDFVIKPSMAVASVFGQQKNHFIIEGLASILILAALVIATSVKLESVLFIGLVVGSNCLASLVFLLMTTRALKQAVVKTE